MFRLRVFAMTPLINMKKTRDSLTNIIIFLSILIVGCDRPECTNTNPVFDSFAPHEEEYKSELARQLTISDAGKLTYWFSEYIKIESREYYYFNIQGDGLCARIALEPGLNEKFNELITKKGISFRGAEFVGLRFDIVRDTSGTSFIMKDFDRIID